MYKRPLAILFALVFSLCVLILDFTAPGPGFVVGLYGWAAVAFAAILLFVGVRNWFSIKSLLPPGVFKPREAVFFIAGVVAAASIASRAMAALPIANNVETLPNWPLFYPALFMVIVGVGAYCWLTGRSLKPWGLFALLTLAAVNGQLFQLSAGSFGVFFGFTAVLFFFQTESLASGKPRLSYVGAALIIFVLAAIASLLWSRDWSGSFRSVYFLANGFLLFVILAREIETADVLALPAGLVWALLLAGITIEVALAAKLVMVAQWIPLNVPPEELFWTMGIPRNAISAYFVGMLPLLLLSVKSPRPAAPRWLLWVQIAFCIAVPALTLSKSAVLGLLVVLWFAFAFWGTERRMNLKLLASSAVAVIVILVLVVVVAIPGGAARFLNPLAYTTRLLTFRVAFAALGDHLITGIGLGSDMGWIAQARVLTPDELVAVPEFLTGRGDSVILNVVGTMGLLGIVALFIVIQTAAWAGITLVKVRSDRFFFGMVSASLAGAAAVLTVAMGLALLSPIPIIIFAALAMYEGGVRRRGLAAASPSWLTTVFIVMVVIGSALGLLATASGQDVARAEALRLAGDAKGAVRCYHRAGFWAPWAAGPHRRLGNFYLSEPDGDLRSAFDSYRAALRRSPGNPDYMEKLGLLAWVLGDDEAAGDYLARAVAADPAGVMKHPHQPYYALYVAAQGDTPAARRLLAEAVIVDPNLCRGAAFVRSGIDDEDSYKTYLRSVPTSRRLPRDLLFALMAVRGYEPRSLRPSVCNMPDTYARDLCLEDVYAEEFRRTFELESTETGRIASPAAYRLGEGYAETRLRAHAAFREAGTVPALASDDADVGLALVPARRHDVEQNRWELQALLGMALLAHDVGELAALPDVVKEFRAEAAELRGEAASEGEFFRDDIDRLRYYQLHDEQPEWDVELAEALLARPGNAREGRGYYRRAVQILLADNVSPEDRRLAVAVRGVLKCDALVAMDEGGGRPGLPRARVSSPAAYAADAVAEEYFGEYKKALVTLRDGAARYPGDAGLAVALADFYERRGLDEKAAEFLSGPAVPRSLSAWRARARAVSRCHGVRAGLAAYNEACCDYPGDLELYLDRAQLQIKNGDAEGARSTLLVAAVHVPAGSLWWSRYGAILLAWAEAGGGLGGPEDVRPEDVGGAAYLAAEAAFATARDINPFDLEPYVVWGEELCRAGRPEEALALLERAVDVDPDSPWARRALAACYLKLGRGSEAERVYKEGVAREGAGSPISLSYDDYYKGKGDDAGRKRVLEAAMEKDPANAAVRERLGEMALATGESEKGLRLLNEALTIEPTSAFANATLGFHYRRTGEAASGVPYLECARAAAPTVDGYRILLADAYVEVGRNRDALAELEAVDDPVRLPKALALRAKAYYNLGEREAAREAAARALELDPGLAGEVGFLAK
ncbi:MAG: tetratricopeptide repeat protein [Candidatus Zixiibacteriota bacterium]